MSTRRLILTALVCGLAILVAGSIQLFRLSRADQTVTVLAEGATAVLGPSTVTVTSSSAVGEQVLVDVTIARAAGAEPALGGAEANWSLLSAGELLAPVVPTDQGALPPCVGLPAPVAGDTVTCTLAFRTDANGSVTLAYRVGETQRQWALSPG